MLDDDEFRYARSLKGPGPVTSGSASLGPFSERMSGSPDVLRRIQLISNHHSMTPSDCGRGDGPGRWRWKRAPASGS